MQNPYTMREFVVQMMTYRATSEIIENVAQEDMDRMVATAEQARINRGIPIHRESMYFIRFQQPPNPRLIIVVFIEAPDGERMNVIAYYDEIGHLFDAGWANGDIKKLSGNPLAGG